MLPYQNTVHMADVVFLSQISALNRLSLANVINSHSRVMFRTFRMLRFLINRLDTLWIQRKGEIKQDRCYLAFVRRSRYLGGLCFKRFRLILEGVGNTGLTLFQRRVLLEMFDQEPFFHLS
jgi:hypothetical protein